MNAVDHDNTILDSVYNNDLYEGREEYLPLTWERCEDIPAVDYAAGTQWANVNRVTVERAPLSLSSGTVHVYRVVDDTHGPLRPGVVQDSGARMYRLLSRDDVVEQARAYVADMKRTVAAR